MKIQDKLGRQKLPAAIDFSDVGQLRTKLIHPLLHKNQPGADTGLEPGTL
jgi:hypothetical protein